MGETEHKAGKESMKLGPNELAFMDYIKQMSHQYQIDTLSVEWVKWMLGEISLANKIGVRINPKWLRSDQSLLNDPEPPMFIK